MKLYGIAELAEATGTRPGTVAQWYSRGQLPKPDALLKMGPVWKGATVAAWIRKIRTQKKSSRAPEIIRAELEKADPPGPLPQ